MAQKALPLLLLIAALAIGCATEDNPIGATGDEKPAPPTASGAAPGGSEEQVPSPAWTPKPTPTPEPKVSLEPPPAPAESEEPIESPSPDSYTTPDPDSVNG